MTTLPDFLLARIAEDEAAAERLRRPSTGDPWGWQPHMHQLETCSKSRVDYPPARVLAECEAKRRIVETCGLIANDPTLPSTHLARHVLQDLALPYADHPDYREEWKP